jgi:prepilin-type N-terminal cleavage/methylation domain-containing protein
MSDHRKSGFTLIEVVVAIVLSAIAMVAILPLLGSVFLASHEPLTQMNEGLALQSAMENLVAKYSTNSLDTLHQAVDAEVASYPGPITVQKQYVEFAGGVEAPSAASDLLKITLQSARGERVVRLFAEPP